MVRFVAPDNKHSKSYHKPTKIINYLNAVPSDFWRFFMPKSDLQGLYVGRCKVVLIRPDWINYNETTFKNEITFPLNNLVPGNTTDRYITSIGNIRKQDCENYCEFKLIVNAFPSGEVRKQFVLQRSTGQGVFGTFTTATSDRFLFMQELKNHFEKNGDASCLCEVNGNVITVRAYTNERFYLNDQECSIAIGRVDESNTNTPQLDARFLVTETIPAQDCYDLTIENIAVGNILTLGSQKITVALGDTIASIRQRLIGDADCYIIDQSERVNYNAEKGSYLEVNQTKPTVKAIYQSTGGGFDVYKIQITGTVLEGNNIQVSCVGKTPITITVTSTDTITTLTDLFNPDTTDTYQVPTGNVPVISVFEGSRIVQNTNALIFTLTNKTAIPARTVDKYKCYISDDVVLRNEFRLMDKTYIAKKGDTALMVAKALGQSTQQFIYEVPTGTDFIAYAQKGKLYGDENIMDIRILKQPKVRKSNQYVCEVKFPDSFPSRLIDCDLRRGEWQLAVYDQTDNALVALGNFIDFNGRVAETKMVEYAGDGEYFGYEYLENGITQRLRVPIMLQNIKHETEENLTNLIDGGYDRKETNIMKYQDFVTKGVEGVNMEAMQILFRHKHITIDGKHYMGRGEFSDNYADDFVAFGQLTGRLYLQGKISNNNSLLGQSVQLGYGTVTVEGEYIGRRVLLMATNNHFIIKESARLKCAEYDIMIDNPQHQIGCIVYVNDLEVYRLAVSAKTRTRIRPYVRLNTDGNIRIVFVDAKELAMVTEYESELLKDDYAVTEYEIETMNENPPNLTGGSFTEGFDEGFEA